MARPRTTPLAAMKVSLEGAKQQVVEAEKELAQAKANVLQFERIVKILEEQEPTPTLIPASAAQTTAKEAAKDKK